MTLQPGQTAPTFQTQDIFDQPVSLDSHTGKWILFSFFRNGACAICNLRIHQLIQQYPKWQHLGLEVIGVFESPAASVRQYVGRQDAPFPIISDPQAQLYDLYCVETSEAKVSTTMQMPQTEAIIQQAAQHGFALTPEEGSNFNRIPADFLIDPTGTLRIAHYAQHLTDHLPFEVIEQTIPSSLATSH